MGTLAWIVFHNPDWCDGPEVSPMVSNHWNRPVVDLLLESQAPFTTNDVTIACARFIGWCYTRPDIDSFQIGVQNTSGRPDPESGDNQAEWAERLVTWYRGLMQQLKAWKHAVLVNVSTFEITQGEAELWRPDSRIDRATGGD